ncbi:hypothetical protein ACLOJK_035915 [Asimina triloba]
MVAKSMMLLSRVAKGGGQSSSCLVRGGAAGAGAGGRGSKQMVVMKKDEAAAAAVGEGADDDEMRRSRTMKQLSMSSWWMPHPRSGIYYPLGHEWVMDDVPEGAASYHFTFWLRNSEGVDQPPSNAHDHPSSDAY